MLHYTEEYLCDLCEASTSHLDLEKLASKKSACNWSKRADLLGFS